MTDNRARIRRSDWILLAAFILAAVILYLVLHLGGGQSGDRVRVYVDGVPVLEVSLMDDGNYPIVTDRQLGVLCVEHGTARMTQAVCRDRICEQTGTISRVGEQIVCLPNRIRIEVDGSSEPEYDGVIE